MSSDTSPTSISDAEFHVKSHDVLTSIEAAIDRWLQEDVVDIDAQRTGGLLELHFPNRSTIVVNTQPPLHELWIAAQDGGYHYKYSSGRWIDTRDGREFFAVLSGCASQQAGVPLEFAAPPALSA